MKFLQRIAKFLSYSPFEAANPSIRRSHVPGAGPTDARKELTPNARRELVRKSRYLMKNSGFAREVVGDMAVYSTGDGIRPQAQSKALETEQKLTESIAQLQSAQAQIAQLQADAKSAELQAAQMCASVGVDPAGQLTSTAIYRCSWALQIPVCGAFVLSAFWQK